MSMDWLSDLINEKATRMEDLAQSNPAEWLEKQLEEDSEHCFSKVGEDRYCASSLKGYVMTTIDVSLDDEGFVNVKVGSGVMADEDTEASFRILQMCENATFRTMGYAPAKAGEEVTFQVVARPSDDLDLSSVIDRCISSVSLQAPQFEKIRAGHPVREVVEAMRGEHLQAARRLSSLLG